MSEYCYEPEPRSFEGGKKGYWKDKKIKNMTSKYIENVLNYIKNLEFDFGNSEAEQKIKELEKELKSRKLF